MKNVLRLMAVVAIASVCAVADQITLTDGSVLKGKISEVFDGKVKIETDYAGKLEIDRAKVANIVTDGPVMVALPEGKIQGAIGAKDGKSTVADKTVEPGAIQTVWTLGGVDPTLPKPPPPRKWAYEADFSIDGKTGNTEKTDFSGGLKATLAGPDDKLVLSLRGKYGREGGEKNAEEVIAKADYEHMIAGTNNSWYVRAEAERDEFENFDLLFTAGGGYGYYLLKDDENGKQVRLRAGVVYQKKKYSEGMEDDDNIALEFNYHHELKIHEFLGFKNLGKLVTDITYTPTCDDWQHDYTVKHESAIDIPLGGSKYWSVRLGVSNEYRSRVARNVERLDTTYFGRLLLNWE